MSDLNIPIHTSDWCSNGADIYHALDFLAKNPAYNPLKKILESFYWDNKREKSLSIADIRKMYHWKMKNKMNLIPDLLTYLQKEKITIEWVWTNKEVYKITPGEISEDTEIPENIQKLEIAIQSFVNEIKKEVEKNTPKVPIKENDNTRWEKIKKIKENLHWVTFQYILDNFKPIYISNKTAHFNKEFKNTIGFDDHDTTTQINIFLRSIWVPYNHLSRVELKTELTGYFDNPDTTISDAWIDIIAPKVYTYNLTNTPQKNLD